MANSKPKLLDLFCGAGGAAMGYYRAGFDVTGIDIEPQRHYPFTFIQSDALDYLAEHGKEFDAIHASPPCQFASLMRNLPWLKDKNYPALIKPTRDLLVALDVPWIIENVYSSRFGSKQLAKLGYAEHGMKAGWLCGTMFGKPFYRHRLFETNFFWMAPGHPRHQYTIRNGRYLGSRVRDIAFSSANGTTSRWQNGAQQRGCGYGHAAGVNLARKAMDISWMTRDELTQAIPPVYTEYTGHQLIKYLGRGEGNGQEKGDFRQSI